MGFWAPVHDPPENVADFPGRWEALYAPADGAVIVAGRDDDDITTAVLRVDYASAEGALDARWDIAYVLAYDLTRVVQRTRQRQRDQLRLRPA